MIESAIIFLTALMFTYLGYLIGSKKRATNNKGSTADKDLKFIEVMIKFNEEELATCKTLQEDSDSNRTWHFRQGKINHCTYVQDYLINPYKGYPVTKSMKPDSLFTKVIRSKELKQCEKDGVELYLSEKKYHKRKLPVLYFQQDHVVNGSVLYVKGDEYDSHLWDYSRLTEYVRNGLISIYK